MSDMKKGNSLVRWYSSMDKLAKECFWIGVVDLAVFAILVPFFLLGYLSLSLGWLLGSAISLISHLTMNFAATSIVREAQSTKKVGTLLGVLFFMLRMILWAAGLIIAAICTYKAEWFGGWNGFNFWTTFAAYLPATVILVISNIRSRNHPQQVQQEEKEGAEQ